MPETGHLRINMGKFPNRKNSAKLKDVLYYTHLIPSIHKLSLHDTIGRTDFLESEQIHWTQEDDGATDSVAGGLSKPQGTAS